MDINKELSSILSPKHIKTRYIDLVSFAADAGFYSMLPVAVVQPINEKEIVDLFKFSQVHSIPLVFRGGGTSLSGQSITDGILVELSQNWNRVSVKDQGNLICAQPGITGAMMNSFLKQYKRKIGPDPSSISAAMIGGILSNNASGMCCGVKLNSYHTMKYIRFILPNGKMYSTEEDQDYVRFEHECSELFHGLSEIKERIVSDDVLSRKIRHKYQIKNTVGYSLNAFIDYEHPLDIFAHLLIGAEGTLAFISEVVLMTVPDYPHKATSLLYFTDISSACKAIIPLAEAGALMVELMDRASLKAIENIKGIPDIIKELPATAAALLIEFQENTIEELTSKVNIFLQSTIMLSLHNAPTFTFNQQEQDFLWKIRKGLFPAVGAVRASGTSVILEDIAFPLHVLGDAVSELQRLFVKYAYDNAIIFGHAKDGNIHFVITQSFDSPSEVERYDFFMRDVVDMVVHKYDGSLKAEHGTGRNMAPFVQTEWGEDAYEIMKNLKHLIDPHQLLNPGVIINKDRHVHLKNLKRLPSVEEEVDRCIECGYCEHVCPSRNITTTPRRRIVIRRVLKQLQLSGDHSKYKLLLGQYQYEGLETCAVDGLCAAACPVDINTGDLMKRLRMENHSKFANKLALLLAQNFAVLEWLIRYILKMSFAVNKILGENTMTYLTRLIKFIMPSMPLWSDQLSYPPKLKPLTNQQSIYPRPVQPVYNVKVNDQKIGVTVIYYPTCISRVLGSYPGKDKNIMETFLSVCNKSGINVHLLDEIKGSCCSQVFSSKGFKEAAYFTANDTISRLWFVCKAGSLPVVTDVSSCANTLHGLRPILSEENKLKFDQMKIYDSIDFLYDYVMPNAVVKQKKGSVVLHPVCSLEKTKSRNKFIALAKHFAAKVTVPEYGGCCGMAGDRGFLFPDLTKSATLAEALEVKEDIYDGYYSSTKTCEIAMSMAVSKNYESILYLLDETL